MASSRPAAPASSRTGPNKRRQESRNLVVCCDGTGNEVSGNQSNVLKLFRVARKDARQHVFYDPGVGTIGNENDWGRLQQELKAVLGLATGAGIDDNILRAYRFLVEAYEEGDRIFLFGFSRGAYTVRALAGFIHMVGLLRPDQLNLCDHALSAYKSADDDRKGFEAFEETWQFGRVTNSRRVTIHFVGVWDTVASFFVPRPDRYYLPSARKLPYTRTNPSVRAFRHAIAIDERRRMFRLHRWTEPQPFVENPFSHPPVSRSQDIAQVWFAGVHADVGGGYAEKESGLSKFPLIWMVEEARTHGLRINEPTFKHVALGETGGRYTYVKPDAGARLHRSLLPAWYPLEALPKNCGRREWGRPRLFGWYLPLGEPRRIATGEGIHPSVAARQAALPAYRPVNLPAREPLKPEGWLSSALRALSGIAFLVALVAAGIWVTLRWWPATQAVGGAIGRAVLPVAGAGLALLSAAAALLLLRGLRPSSTRGE